MDISKLILNLLILSPEINLLLSNKVEIFSIAFLSIFLEGNYSSGKITSSYYKYIYNIKCLGPLAVNGYYPLYTTPAAANAASLNGNSGSRTFIFNGVSYYMPVGGSFLFRKLSYSKHN